MEPLAPRRVLKWELAPLVLAWELQKIATIKIRAPPMHATSFRDAFTPQFNAANLQAVRPVAVT